MHLSPAKYSDKNQMSDLLATAGLAVSSRSSSLLAWPPSTLDIGSYNKANQFTVIDNHRPSMDDNYDNRSRSSQNIDSVNDPKRESLNGVDHLSSTILSLDYHQYYFHYNNNRNKIHSFSSGYSGKEIDKFDRVKFFEESIINLVELSSLAAEEEKFELALDRAKEAQEVLDSLKVIMVQDQTRSSSSFSNQISNHLDEYHETQPLTTGVNLFDLSIMVKSNLAEQFKNNNNLGESLELYTHLCKLMSNATGKASSSVSASTAGQQHGSRFLLYRFGLNIGNVLFEMNEYQRALKYYRLTLDRLSSPGNRNLRIKLMNNIAITLMTMNGDEQPTTDTITSFDRLLADNLLLQQQSCKSNSAQANAATSQEYEVCNSNHHKFVLNLMVCHYQRADLRSMMTTLKAHVKVDICHQYKRVFDCLDSDNNDKQPSAKNESSRRESWNHEGRGSPSLSMASSTAETAAGSGGFAHALNRQSPISGSQDAPTRHVAAGIDTIQIVPTSLGADRQFDLVNRGQQSVTTTRPSTATSSNRASITVPYGIEWSSIDGVADNTTTDVRTINQQQVPQASTMMLSGGNRLTTSLRQLYTADRSRQMMISIRADKLEKLICKKENEISRSLIMSCNLMLDLDNRIRRSRLSVNHNDRHQSDSHTSASIKNQVDDSDQTSVFDYCLRLLESSEIYKSLLCNLKTNRIAQMLSKKNKLDDAIRMLEEIDSDQQAAVNDQKPKSAGLKRTSASAIAGNCGSNSGNFKQSNSRTMISSGSAIVATNLSLLYLLRNQFNKATELAERALKIDRSSVESWINLANCHYQLNNLEHAENCYEQAISINPNGWIANYNLALLHRKLGHHFDELKPSTKSILMDDRKVFAALLYAKMLLSPIQLSLLYNQSGMNKQSHVIMCELLNETKQSPEVYLLASKLISELDSETFENATYSPLTILQSANRVHSYHVPIAERLVALYISKFNYTAAGAILHDCIKNRPDQVKWYQMLAECYRRAADYSQAIKIYKTAIDLFPFDTSCLKALTKLTNELGLVEESKAYQMRLDQTLKRLGKVDTL